MNCKKQSLNRMALRKKVNFIKPNRFDPLQASSYKHEGKFTPASLCTYIFENFWLISYL